MQSCNEERRPSTAPVRSLACVLETTWAYTHSVHNHRVMIAINTWLNKKLLRAHAHIIGRSFDSRIVKTASMISIGQVLFVLLSTLLHFLFFNLEIHVGISPFSETVASDCFGLILLICLIFVSLIEAGGVGS